MRRSLVRLSTVVALAAGTLGYLRNPGWTAAVTSGLRAWEEDPPGTRFRWTAGRASFFIPADAATMTLPMRAVFPGTNGRPVVVSVSIDDRWLADIALPDPEVWVKTPLPLPRRPSARRFRRVDLHVNRTAVGAFVLGVMTGEISLDSQPR
jgi:hypothetical protein